MSFDSTSDDKLMREVRDGDARKLALLFERHHAKLYRYYLRMTADRQWAEDLVQEVFFRMLRHSGTYKPEFGFTTWMYRIARNAYIDQLRKKKWEVAMDETWDAPAEAGQPLERRQEVELLRRALAKLPDDKRDLLVMSRFQGLKYEQIAGILECEPGAVKVRVFRAMQALRNVYFELAGRKAS